jgi:hypothetical protein
MKLLPSFKSARAIALAAVTVATALASHVTPSQAADPAVVTPVPPGTGVPVRIGPPASAPTPIPASVTLSFANRGSYIVGYRVSYTLSGSQQIFDTGNLAPGQQKTIPLPKGATPTRIEAKSLGSGFPFQNGSRTFFDQNLSNATANLCFTSTGTIFAPRVDNSCGAQPVTPPVAVRPGNLIQNGNFGSGLANWDAVNTVIGNVRSPDVNVGIMQPRTGQLLQSFSTTVGVKYRVKFDVQTQISTDRSNYKVSTFPLFSNVSFKLSDLTSTPNGSVDRYSFEITGADRRPGSNETTVKDTINFTNSSNSTNFVITNVSIEQI